MPPPSFFAAQCRKWREFEEEYHKLYLRGKLVFQCSTGLNRVRKYLGRRPGLFKADCYDQAEKLAADIDKLREKLHAFFRENQLSDAEEFIEERLAMLTPAIEEPENPEMEKQELL